VTYNIFINMIVREIRNLQIVWLFTKVVKRRMRKKQKPVWCKLVYLHF